MSALQDGPRFPTREPVDFVVVGSGAAGGIMAKELSEAGFDVVVLEQGPHRKAEDFRHDEYGTWMQGELSATTADFATSFRASPDEEAQPVTGGMPAVVYSRGVGGSSVHFTGNFWRFRPIDFNERSVIGPISGTGLADWPITYEELEPYYTRVEWDIGVSGAPGPNDPPRSRPFPVPPLPVKSSGVLLEKGARAMGWTPQPASMAILSQSHNGRNGCIHCGWCIGYGCESGAKSSTLAAMIPLAEATGRCEIRPLSTVYRLETDDAGRVSEVLYYDGDGNPQGQRARAVVVCANGAETARLLLMSESSRFPNGLANSSGLVGKYLMFNGNAAVSGLFEEQLNEYKSVQVTRLVMDFYDSDPARGFYGGGALDGRTGIGPMGFALFGLPRDVPQWGPEFKRAVAEYFTRSMDVFCHGTSLPLESNSISLDPQLKDSYDRPAIRLTYKDHPDDLAFIRWLQERAEELLDAAGARRTWYQPAQAQTVGFHLLGTARMGDDPAASVVDRYHRAHDVPNLFVCDGSSLVTAGRGQPTMTIQALAFRAAEHIARFATQNEI